MTYERASYEILRPVNRDYFKGEVNANNNLFLFESNGISRLTL